MKTILVVDDRPVNREFLRTLLSYSGFQVLEAGDGVQALKVVRIERPDLVIVDIVMPTMDGFEFVRALRSHPAVASVPVIFYTATYREKEARSVADLCGVQHVLIKPCEPEIILRTVNSVLGLADSQPPKHLENPVTKDLGLLTDVLQDTLRESRRAAARLAGVTELSLELASKREIAVVMEAFTRGARELIASGFSLVGILTKNGKLEDFCVDGVDAATEKRLGKPDFSVESVLQSVLENSAPVRLYDATAHFSPIPFQGEQFHTMSFLAVPMIGRAQTIGVLCFADKIGEQQFSHEDERLAITLAAQFSVLYESARLHSELKEHASLLERQILEREQAEETLRKLSSAVQQSGDSVLITDKEGVIEYVNPTFEKLTGYTREEVIGKTPAILKSGLYDLKFYQGLWKTIRSGKIFRFQFINRKKNGDLITEEQTITPIRNEAGIITHFVSTAKDITERQKAAKALQASEERFRQIAEAISEVFWISDPANDTMYYISPAYERIWQRSCESLYDDPLSFMEAIHPEERTNVQKERERQLKGGNFDMEYRIVRPDGSIRWIWARGFPVLNDAGKVIRIAGIAQDITHRKGVEVALRESEEKFRLAFEEGPVGMALVGEDFRFISVNRAYTEMTGYTEKELKDLSFAELTHPLDRAQDLERAERLFRGEIPNYQLQKRSIKKDGEELWVQLTATLIRDDEGKIRYAFAMIENIHHRKQAEKYLAAQNEATRALAESSTLPEAISKILQILCESLRWDFGEMWMLTSQSNSLQCIDIWHSAEFSGYKFAESARNREFASGVGLPGTVRARGELLWIENVQTSSILQRVEEAKQAGLHTAVAFPIKANDEIIAALQFFSRQIREADPALMQIFASIGTQIGQFIERKRSEDEQADLKKKLLQSQKMEAIGQLAGGVAHDFNNVLMAIGSFCELLLISMKEEEPLRRFVTEIEKATQQGAGLTRQLLAFSRKQVMAPKVLNLTKSISKMKEMLERLIGENIQLVTISGSPVGQIEADPGQIEQVLMNLAVNARDAMPNGGKLTIEAFNIEVDESLAARIVDLKVGQYVGLAVSDTGHGMDESVLNHVFEPFFTTKPEGKGTGLGLSTVYGIVKQTGGSIIVYSQVGTGTTFKIFFPRIDKEALESGRLQRTSANVAGAGKTILVTDDNESVRNAISSFLELKGYRVFQAGRASEAIEIIRSNPNSVHLLISDVVMPEMNGRELARQLKTLAPDVKILLMSGYTEEAVRRQGTIEEGTAFLSKPVRMETLLLKIGDLIHS